ncbi:RND transporter hydrophobe/amphiphile efflux-1 (HAE1) family [Klebsiella variicola]|uniref:RND transporter hydrophobe/amphiphile efflux-1 (HAE1) family n=1 Tax=Klebsiella variicola TaxID=244366 RepID=A0A7H4MK59_KLEVA|nr:RND transporter hydrophobe/amphiphile efflux-1 (HAE1) family [Klebsiella variicola]
MPSLPQPVYRVNGKPAIGLAISMAPTGNMLRFGAALNAKMQAISVTLPHVLRWSRLPINQRWSATP